MNDKERTTSKKAVCWVITEEDEGSAQIVFHQHRLAARRIGIRMHGGDDNDYASYNIRRAPEFDQYADKGFVPARAMLENGWWLYSETGERLSYNDGDEEDEGAYQWDRLVFTQNERGVYKCMDECHSHALEINDRNDKFVKFKETIISSWPELDFTKWTGGYPWITFTGEFTFPGSKYGGSIRWDSDKPEEKAAMYVANGDKAVWDEFYASIRPEERLAKDGGQ